METTTLIIIYLVGVLINLILFYLYVRKKWIPDWEWIWFIVFSIFMCHLSFLTTILYVISKLNSTDIDWNKKIF
jgi:hypothetical protein